MAEDRDNYYESLFDKYLNDEASSANITEEPAESKRKRKNVGAVVKNDEPAEAPAPETAPAAPKQENPDERSIPLSQRYNVSYEKDPEPSPSEEEEEENEVPPAKKKAKAKKAKKPKKAEPEEPEDINDMIKSYDSEDIDDLSDTDPEEYISDAEEDIEDEEFIPEKKVKKKKPHYVARVFLCIFTVLLMLIITISSAMMMIAYGPSPTIRKICVLSAKQASATKWIPDLFLSEETVTAILEAGDSVNADVVDIEDIAVEDEEDEWADAIDGMKLIFRQEPNFKAYILLVKDPSRVKLGVSSEEFSTATAGMRIFDIAEKYKCVAAINGGEFSDPGGQGTGSQPIGITYEGGRCVWGGSGNTFIGLDKDNNLVCVEGMNKSKADELGVRDGCCFMRNNVIIERDGSNVKLNYADDNLGIAQKTGIGQRADGTIIMIVTDGRSAESVGATRNDLIDLFVEYGAVIAGMLDGGSSSMLYYRDYFDAYQIDKNGLEEYQQMGLVNRYKAFTKPRRIPTYFIVMPGEES